MLIFIRNADCTFFLISLNKNLNLYVHGFINFIKFIVLVLTTPFLIYNLGMHEFV